MADTFRITGLNNILFDSGPTGTYVLKSAVEGMSDPITRARTLTMLSRLPQTIRSYILGRHPEYPMSIISFQFDIKAASGAAMEDAVHDLQETLQDTLLYFSTAGARGTEAVLEFKKSGAAATSYKSIFYGVIDEARARSVEAVPMMDHDLVMMRLTLYCEAYWRPSAATNLVTTADVYNHDDGDANHDNFVDITAANIKGDVPARTRVLIADENSDKFQFVYCARRTVGTPSSFDHWLEAEDAASQTNWADAADVTRSAGNIVSDATSATSGQIDYLISTNLDHFKGRLAVYAALWASDITNTKFRMWWKWALPTLYYGKWKWLGKASTWQLAHLATIDMGPNLYPPGDTIDRIRFTVEYSKDANDTCKCDYIMLLPIDESVMQLEGSYWLDQATGWDGLEADGLADFPNYYMVETATGDFIGHATMKGGFLTLQPNVNNRIYFKALSVATGGDPLDEHDDRILNNGVPATRFDVTIDYLPQYISPLE